MSSARSDDVDAMSSFASRAQLSGFAAAATTPSDSNSLSVQVKFLLPSGAKLRSTIECPNEKETSTSAQGSDRYARCFEQIAGAASAAINSREASSSSSLDSRETILSSLEYKDSDGDWCLLQNGKDLSCALQHLRHFSHPRQANQITIQVRINTRQNNRTKGSEKHAMSSQANSNATSDDEFDESINSESSNSSFVEVSRHETPQSSDELDQKEQQQQQDQPDQDPNSDLDAVDLNQVEFPNPGIQAIASTEEPIEVNPPDKRCAEVESKSQNSNISSQASFQSNAESESGATQSASRDIESTPIGGVGQQDLPETLQSETESAAATATPQIVSESGSESACADADANSSASASTQHFAGNASLNSDATETLLEPTEASPTSKSLSRLSSSPVGQSPKTPDEENSPAGVVTSTAVAISKGQQLQLLNSSDATQNREEAPRPRSANGQIQVKSVPHSSPPVSSPSQGQSTSVASRSPARSSVEARTVVPLHCAAAGRSADSRADSDLITNPVKHTGVQCSMCARAIRGTRWLCTECSQFNACDDCLSRLDRNIGSKSFARPDSDSSHLPSHIMLKMRTPQDAEETIRTRLRAFAHLHSASLVQPVASISGEFVDDRFEVASVSLSPGESINLSFRIRNTGLELWPAGTHIYVAEGDFDNLPAAASRNGNVTSLTRIGGSRSDFTSRVCIACLPGESLRVQIRVVAPIDKGDYKLGVRLCSPTRDIIACSRVRRVIVV